ncbi:hypothetical protein YYE_04974, partial [Plasmodium vinckei vinckei]
MADSYFNGKNVYTTKINEDPAINGFCNNGGCKTNEAGINAFVAYIITSFKRSIENHEYNKYDEYFLMWLSDKLFKIHDKSEDKDNEITLNQAYDTYLEKYKGIFDYWSHFDIIKDLKEANLKYMSEFYKLLNHICKTITDYENNPEEITNLITNSTECSNQYISIYNDIPKCQSYLDLLNKLKGIYDDFRNDAIMRNDSNNDLKTKLQTLTKPDGKEMDGKKGFISYDFSNSTCKFKKKSPSLKKEDNSSLQPSNQLKDSQDETPSSSQSSNALEKTKTGESSPSNVQDDSKIDLKTSENSKGNTGSSSSGTGNLGDESSDQVNSGVEKENMNDGVKEPEAPSNGKGSQVSKGDGENVESVDTDIEIGDSE